MIPLVKKDAEEANRFKECITEILPPTNEMGSNSSLPSSASFLTKGSGVAQHKRITVTKIRSNYTTIPLVKKDAEEGRDKLEPISFVGGKISEIHFNSSNRLFSSIFCVK